VVNTKKLLAAVGVGMAAVLAVTATPAQADPTGPPTFRQIVAVGSDTTEDVMNGLSEVVVDPTTGEKLVASYDAFGGTIQTRPDPTTCTGLTRPAGSGNGVTALVNTIESGANCYDIARSSSNNSASFAGKNLTYVVLGIDALTYAIRSDSTISKKLTKAQLTTVYNCGGGANFKPLLPQFGSGTRSFFLGQLGFTDAANFVTQPNHTCIVEVDTSGNPLQENNGTLLQDPKNIAPYSVAKWISQAQGVVADIHGKTVLGNLDNISPLTLNTEATMRRTVYNVVPDSKLSTPLYQNVFVGPTSQICSGAGPTTVKKYGFGVAPNCGDTTLHTP
jgi:ABC-type phosphate transport system substrate-binding protein